MRGEVASWPDRDARRRHGRRHLGLLESRQVVARREPHDRRVGVARIDRGGDRHFDDDRRVLARVERARVRDEVAVRVGKRRHVRLQQIDGPAVDAERLDGVERVGTGDADVLDGQRVVDLRIRHRVLRRVARGQREPDGQLPEEAVDVPSVVLDPDPAVRDGGERRGAGARRERVRVHDRAVDRVDRVQRAIPARPVQEAVREGGRRAHRSRDARLPQDTPGQGVEGDVFPVEIAEVDRGPVVRRGGDVDQGESARRPDDVTRGGVQGSLRSRVVSDVNVPLGIERRRRHGVPDAVAPDLRAGELVECVDGPAQACEVRNAGVNRGARHQTVAVHLERPRDGPVRGVQGVRLTAPRRAEDEAVRIGHRDARVEVESRLRTDDPDRVARVLVERVHGAARAAVERRIEHAVVADRRARVVEPAAQRLAPEDVARLRITGPQRPVEGRGEQNAVRHDGTVPELEGVRAVLPHQVDGRLEVTRGPALPRQVVVERRPFDARRCRRRSRRRHERVVVRVVVVEREVPRLIRRLHGIVVRRVVREAREADRVVRHESRRGRHVRRRSRGAPPQDGIGQLVRGPDDGRAVEA